MLNKAKNIKNLHVRVADIGVYLYLWWRANITTKHQNNSNPQNIVKIIIPLLSSLNSLLVSHFIK